MPKLANDNILWKIYVYEYDMLILIFNISVPKYVRLEIELRKVYFWNENTFQFLGRNLSKEMFS